MNKNFIKWLSEQEYRYFVGDPLNDDTTQDWMLDEAIKSSKSKSGLWNWNKIVESEKWWVLNYEQQF
jgi:hypothetical protein